MENGRASLPLLLPFFTTDGHGWTRMDTDEDKIKKQAQSNAKNPFSIHDEALFFSIRAHPCPSVVKFLDSSCRSCQNPCACSTCAVLALIM